MKGRAAHMKLIHKIIEGGRVVSMMQHEENLYAQQLDRREGGVCRIEVEVIDLAQQNDQVLA